MEYKIENIKLADVIFKDITETIEDLEKKYPERNLKEGSKVTRFAPSPTGFLHTGALFTTLVNRTLAKETDGVFYLRIEDTDGKREVEGSAKKFIEELSEFNLAPEEGVVGENKEQGVYGPYKQSDRGYIYKVCAKELIKRGLAYPCFCSPEDLDTIRSYQEENKLIKGYYGRFARCRNLEVEEAIKRIENGEKFIIRLRSQGSHLRKVKYKDLVRGNIEIAENDMDIVIVKSDGLPTYHFAHAVDDHFMRTTTVVRGEEWIASVPVHLELFKLLGFKAPDYAHLPTIMKLDNGSKRKLSKRKDPESAVSYFLENGYPQEGVLEYLMGIINSDFEPWRRANKDKSLDEFNMKVSKISTSGALFDIVKLNDVCKEYIARLNSEEVLEAALSWANKYNKEYAERLNSNLDLARKIFAMERDNAKKVRKDIYKFSDLEETFSYFYSDLFAKEEIDFSDVTSRIDKEIVKDVLATYKEVYNENVDKQEWFAGVKALAEEKGFCTDMKAYKQEPEKYIGNTSHVAEIIRLAVTGRVNSPDIYEIMQILGKEEVLNRLAKAIELI